MKKAIALTLSLCVTIFFTNCSQRAIKDPNQSNPDSVKKIILAISHEMFQARNNPEKLKKYYEDSLLVVGDDFFMTSSEDFLRDLYTHISVPPHDFTIKLFGNTAIVSSLETVYDLINGDTIFHSLRNLRIFAFNGEKWKVASYAFGKQTVNYYRPVIGNHEKAYAAYVGIYQSNVHEADTVFVKDGNLFDKSGSDAQLNFPVSDNEYMINGDLGKLSFGRDAKGVVSYYTITNPDGQHWKCPKIK